MWLTTSTCYKCQDGYELKYDSTKCREINSYRFYGPKYDFTIIIGINQAILILGIALSFGNAILTKSSYHSTFAIIHQVQLLLLLPMIAKYMSNTVENFILSMGYLAFQTSFKTTISILLIQPIFDEFNLPQKDKYLQALGLQSGSTYLNYFGLVPIFFSIGIIHIYMLCRYQNYVRQRNRKQRCMAKFLQFLTYSLYIRIAIEVFTFTLVCSLSEIKYFTYYDEGSTVSMILAWVLLLVCISLIIISIWSWHATKNIDIIDYECKTREFYQGIKLSQPSDSIRALKFYERSNDERDLRVSNKTKKVRSYIIFFFIRRLMQIFLITFMEKIFSYSFKIVTIGLTQIIHVVLILFLNSFEAKTDQIWEVFNELMYLLYCAWLSYFTSKNKWNTAYGYSFIWLIIINTTFITSVSTINFVREWTKRFQAKLNKKATGFKNNQPFANMRTVQGLNNEENKISSNSK